MNPHNTALLETTAMPEYLAPGSKPRAIVCTEFPDGVVCNWTAKIPSFVLIGFALPDFIHFLALLALVGINGFPSGPNTGTLIFEIILTSYFR